MRKMTRVPARALLLASLGMAAGVGVAAVGATADHVASVEENRFAGTVADPRLTGLRLEVGATDDQGHLVPGEWQDADDEAGIDLALAGAEGIFPGSEPLVVTVPVRNASAELDAHLALTLRGDPGRPTVTDYLDAMRFTVEQPATSLAGQPVVSARDLTLDEVENLDLNPLAASEESTVTLTLRVASVDEIPDATWVDDDLSGERGFFQAVFDATSP